MVINIRIWPESESSMGIDLRLGRNGWNKMNMDQYGNTLYGLLCSPLHYGSPLFLRAFDLLFTQKKIIAAMMTADRALVREECTRCWRAIELTQEDEDPYDDSSQHTTSKFGGSFGARL